MKDDKSLVFCNVQRNINKSKMLNVLLITLALLLNQTKVIAQINMSFSDILMFFVLTNLFFHGLLFFPKKVNLFLIFLTITTVSTATLWVPIKFLTQPPMKDVLMGLIKLLTVFMYLFVGYNLVKLKKIDIVLKWFSIGAVCIAVLSVLYSFVDSLPFKDFFYFTENRFSGMMNDPNYFSVIQCVALVYFLFNYNKSFKVLIIVLLLAFSVIVTGSKTGTITLFFILLIKILNLSVNNKGSEYKKTCILFFFFLITLLFFFLLTRIQIITPILEKNIPGFERVGVLFTNFDAAFHSEGSTRDLAWGNAVKIIKISPILGIGSGTYSYLADSLFYSKTIAHNTYLQLFVEWGIPVAVFSFGYLFLLLVGSYKNSKNKYYINIMLLPLLIGSFALSLNNSRLFWILLGALFCYSEHKEKSTIDLL